MNHNSLIKNYVKELKTLLPAYHLPEKNYVSFIEQEIHTYACSVDTLTREDLVLQFGEPKDLVASYLAESSPEELQKSLQFTKHIKRAIACAVVFAFMGLSIFSLFQYLSYKEGQDSYIGREETTITTINEED